MYEKGMVTHMSESKEKKVPFTTKMAGVLRAVSGKPHPKNFTSAVICAAGSSTRMGEGKTKQFMELDGVPVLPVIDWCTTEQELEPSAIGPESRLRMVVTDPSLERRELRLTTIA